MRVIQFFLTAMAIVLLTGCATNDALRKSQQDLQYQMDAKNKESQKYMEDQNLRLNATVDALNERNNSLESRIALLERKVDELQKMNGVSMQKWEQENAQLRKLLQAEQQTRQASLNKMADQMSKETVDMFKKQQEALKQQQQEALKQQQEALKQQQLQRAKEAKEAKEAAATSGSFYEYTVQQGATLNTIAKAAGVSVAEIKAANKMKTDTVRVGQKLLIPAKK